MARVGFKPGRLDQTTFIQRVDTTGGLAPAASACTAATAGTQAEVPYTADYYFWKRHRDHLPVLARDDPVFEFPAWSSDGYAHHLPEAPHK